MRKLLVLALATVLAVSLAAVSTAATKSIKVGDNYYVRASGTPTVTVKAGTTVVWRFQGKVIHNVKVSSGPAKFASPTKAKGTYSKKVTRKGTYTIFCTIHSAADQKMKLKVR